MRSGTGEPVKVCDVGAGNGHVTLDLLRAFPDADERAPLRAFVQDVPATLELAKQVSSHFAVKSSLIEVFDESVTFVLSGGGKTILKPWMRNGCSSIR